MEKRIVEVLLPIPLPHTYSYLYEGSEDHLVGRRATVPFGNQKLIGLIVGIGAVPPSPPLKKVERLLDHRPVVHPWQVRLWQAIAKLSGCTTGEVMRLALPPIARRAPRRLYTPARHWQRYLTDPSPAGDLARLFLTHTLLSPKEIARELQLGTRSAQSLIRQATRLQIIALVEKAQTELPRMRRFCTLTTPLPSATLTPQEKSLISRLQQLQTQLATTWIPVTALTQGNPQLKGTLNHLVKKGIITITTQPGTKHTLHQQTTAATLTLSSQKFLSLLRSHERLFVECDQETLYELLSTLALTCPAPVLVVVPEIHRLATVARQLAPRTGKRTGLYHSHMSDRERWYVWHGILEERWDIVVGTRSALLLPFKRLGAIAVADEHNHVLAEEQRRVQYDGRIVAQWLAHQLSAKLVFFSPAFSVAGWHASTNIRHTFVKHNWWTKVELFPLQHPTHPYLNRYLAQQVRTTIESGKQAFILHLRSSASTSLMCTTCGWKPLCAECGVSMRRLLSPKVLRCSQCGYREPHPHACHRCGNATLVASATGLKEVADWLAIHLPASVPVHIWDAHFPPNPQRESLRTQVLQGKPLALVGTSALRQLLNSSAGLIAIVLAEAFLLQDSYRSSEEFWTLVCELAASTPPTTRILIQSYRTEEPTLQQLVHNRREQFYKEQLEQRTTFAYPPATLLLAISFSSANQELACTTHQQALEKLSTIAQVHLSISPPHKRGRLHSWKASIRTADLPTFQQIIKWAQQLRHSLPSSARMDILADWSALFTVTEESLAHFL